jgi:hypothetical protein
MQKSTVRVILAVFKGMIGPQKRLGHNLTCQTAPIERVRLHHFNFRSQHPCGKNSCSSKIMKTPRSLLPSDEHELE